MIMGLKNKIMAAALGLITLFGPTLNIHSKQETIEQKVEYKTEITLEQNKAQARDYNLEGRLTVLGFDLLINGLKSGIGAKYNGDDFWPAFGKGVLSGAVVYAGKEIASFNEFPFLGATGKLVHDLGVSMSDNVMLSKPILSRYVTDFGPLEVHFEKGKDTKIYVHISPIVSIIKNFADKNKFELKETIYNFTPVFSFEVPLEIQQKGEFIGGYASQNIMTYCRNCQTDNFDLSSKSHEMNHVLFFSEFRFIDDLMPKKSEMVEKMLFLHPLAPLADYIRIGPMLAQGIFILPKLFSEKAYWYSPQELEAYTMQRPQYKNSHPFYR